MPAWLARHLPRGKRPSITADHKAYLVPATGVVEVNGLRVAARDGAAGQNEKVLRVRALEDAEIVLVDTADAASLQME